ncbi:MAG TPA: hypothetical protein VF790_00645 [Dissulfurispiraceae bacterium]
MKMLFGKKRLLLAIAAGVLIAGLLSVVQVTGVDPLRETVWAAFAPGVGVSLMWDIVRLAMSRFEPAWTLTKDVQFWGSAAWVRYLMNPEVDVRAKKSYDARLYDVVCI